MKSIFRKFHIGGGQDPSRSGEISSSPAGAAAAATALYPFHSLPITGLRRRLLRRHHRPQWMGREWCRRRGGKPAQFWEFQVQLALAISASKSEFREDPDGDQIRAAKLLSLGTRDQGRQEEGAAQLLSQRYWDYNVLDYDEKVVDGFYDIFGLPNKLGSQGKMPSLHDLQTSIGDLGFEVIIVNRTIDNALVELEQVAHCISLDFPAAEVVFLVQRVSELVSQHMGGPVKDANEMLVRWIEKSTELRSSLQTSLLPIGCINIGLSRHRALLFKVLADNVGIPCKLVKGSHYTGVDGDAVNIIKYGDHREFLVDLMAAPGTLIPADVPITEDASLKSYNVMVNQNLIPWNINNSGDYFSRGESGNYNLVGDKMLDGRPSRENMALLPSLLGESSANAASSSSGNAESLYQHGISNQILSSTSGATSSGDSLDSRNLFSELNPFQALVVGKPSSAFKASDHRTNEYQRSREPGASGPGRPHNQSPLVRKSHYPCIDVSNTKHYNFVEGVIPKNNVGDRDLNTSPYASSSTGSSMFNPMSSSGTAFPVSADDTSRTIDCSSGATNSSVTLGPSQNGKVVSVDPPINKSLFQIQSEKHGLPLRNNASHEAMEREKNVNAKQDRRRRTHDRFMGRNMAPENSDPSVSYTQDRFIGKDMVENTNHQASLPLSRPSRIDPMLDDVAEWEIPWEDLVIGERIGLGSYGEVYHADWNGTEVAVKKFLDQDFYGDALDEFRSEVRIMRRLRHPNIVLFLGAVARPPNLSIVSEFLPRGSLYKILHRPNCQIDEQRRIKMALDVAKGMNCLHTSAPIIVHRDLKSPNLLVDKNWTVKVCDFGLSRLKHSTFLSSKSTAGTPEWMAPEVLRNEPSNEKCDVYSFGVILWELATLRKPWSGMNPMQVVGAVGFQNRRLEIPNEIDPLVSRIIWECWQMEPSLRPSFAQLTTALKSLQRLVVSPHHDSQNPMASQEIPVNSTP
ncbi:serine/threonine-protein kinase EDR1-like [Phalaenopsis equestris]|uniref:serine/threonine-protein kinase EDR1-like n=1 Tax=Phalaenopsis equestris TaxID=78828 RepID=UPI0009E2EA91|nr:serine/threonine-protein kinase EDR1-like [Phalaenopsis equestris]